MFVQTFSSDYNRKVNLVVDFIKDGKLTQQRCAKTFDHESTEAERDAALVRMKAVFFDMLADCARAGYHVEITKTETERAAEAA